MGCMPFQTVIFSLETHLSLESWQKSRCDLNVPYALQWCQWDSSRAQKSHTSVCKAASLSQESQQSLREKNRRMFINCKAVTLLLYPEKAMRHQSVIPSSPVRSRFVRHSVDSTPTTSSLWMWLSVCSNTRGVITSFLKFGDFLMVCLTHTSDPFLSIFSLPKDN